MSYVSRCSFPYGHSVRPGQSSGSGDVQISTSCPRPHCLPIRRRVTTIGDRFRPDPANPVSVSKHSTVYRIGRGNSTRKSIHPNYLHGRAYQPPSPDPHDRSRGGGFFCQRFFARLEMHTSDVTYLAPRNGRAMASRLNASNSDRSASYAFSRLPLVIS